MADRTRDVIIIGAGQAGLSVAYHLRRAGLSVALLDAQPGPGAAWRHAWPSLRLFSPASSSSLHGWMMPDPGAAYPTRDAMLAYLAAYEARYKFEIARPVRVTAVRRDAHSGFALDVDAGAPWRARALVSATGTWDSPVEPGIPGRARFEGRQRHSAHYAGPASYEGLRVLVVGGGNSGAQIMAEVAPVSDATWVTLSPARFLPEHVDGRHLFEQATRRFEAMQRGDEPPPPASLGDVVQVASVREARAAGLLRERRMFVAMTPTGVIWPEGDEEAIDAIIWCTGFTPALSHLEPLGVIAPDGRVAVEGSRSKVEPMLWLVGYGEWTGFASATIIGVGRHARQAAREVQDALGAHRAT